MWVLERAIKFLSRQHAITAGTELRKSEYPRMNSNLAHAFSDERWSRAS